MSVEARKTLRLLLEDLDAIDFRAARALFGEANERLDRFRLALEYGLERPVRPVAGPAGDAAGLCRPCD